MLVDGAGRVDVPKLGVADDALVDTTCRPMAPLPCVAAYCPGPFGLSRPSISSAGRRDVPNLTGFELGLVLSGWVLSPLGSRYCPGPGLRSRIAGSATRFAMVTAGARC